MQRNTTNLSSANPSSSPTNLSSPEEEEEEESFIWSSNSSSSGAGSSTLSGDTDLESEEFLALECQKVNTALVSRGGEGGGDSLTLEEQGDEEAANTNKTGSIRELVPLKRVKESQANSSRLPTFTPVQKQRLKKLRKKMFRKLNCGRCTDAVRGCCHEDDNGEYMPSVIRTVVSSE